MLHLYCSSILLIPEVSISVHSPQEGKPLQRLHRTHHYIIYIFHYIFPHDLICHNLHAKKLIWDILPLSPLPLHFQLSFPLNSLPTYSTISVKSLFLLSEFFSCLYSHTNTLKWQFLLLCCSMKLHICLYLHSVNAETIFSICASLCQVYIEHFI